MRSVYKKKLIIKKLQIVRNDTSTKRWNILEVTCQEW